MDPATTGFLGALGGALLTGVLGYLAALRPARMARRSADADREVARAALEADRQERATDRLTQAWELLRSDDEHARRTGLRVLRAMLREPHLGRLADNVLDEMAQEELGRPLEELRAAWADHGELPPVDIEVSDADTGDGAGDGADDGPAGGDDR